MSLSYDSFLLVVLAHGPQLGMTRRAATVTLILKAAGKSVDDLEGDVAQRKERIRLRELAATVPALEKRATDLRSSIAKEDAKLERARAAHEAAVNPLAWSVRAAEDELDRARSAASKLEAVKVSSRRAAPH